MRAKAENKKRGKARDRAEDTLPERCNRICRGTVSIFKCIKQITHSTYSSPAVLPMISNG